MRNIISAPILAHYLYFEKKYKSRLMQSPCCLSALADWLNLSLRKLACMSWHLSPSQRRNSHIPPISLCVYVYPIQLTRERLGKNAATNTHETIKEFLEASFYMESVSYQRKVGD
jgi:hypothetical protein